MDAHNSERFLSIQFTLPGYDEPFNALRFIQISPTACAVIHLKHKDKNSSVTVFYTVHTVELNIHNASQYYDVHGNSGNLRQHCSLMHIAKNKCNF